MQLDCWSLRCSWSIACGHCSNYIFILHWALGFNILRTDNCKPRRETFKFYDLVCLILDMLRCIKAWTSYLFAHYTIPLSISCRLIWRHWTNKNIVRHILSSACNFNEILIIVSVIYGTVRIKLTHPSCDYYGSMWTLLYYHIGSMKHDINHCLRFRSGNNGLRCMTNYILIHICFAITVFANEANRSQESLNDW